MASTVGIIRAIGVVLLAPAYFDSPITLDDLNLLSKIDNETRLRSKIKPGIEPNEILFT